MRQTICVDLNGVLDTYCGWRGEVTWHAPREGAAEFLRALRARGYAVVVLTARHPEQARQWLDEHDLGSYVDAVTNVKPPAFAYIDDRAVCFRGDFSATLQELDAFQPHWQEQAARAVQREEHGA